ncbi:diacylglycerol kinase [Candidatus Nomurabacteria bacterium RIFCSPLOWO2_01_FULL_41_12]|uniref:Diacylglycerol kinase n=1 Tax=Candidatus Nomurabacteria bacterium RIFCSPLOWO2_01_FULL_41_12 TaxID=1801774 RepID=A0A1F6WWY3_9BACT|nr:MAG: diacylglycerol kinase [Candidatus Nomurabacteria bacterium RIFCSPLOWO2_01_FULL_41_12]
MDSLKEKKDWSLVKRAQSFTHAFRGIRLFFTMTPNALLHLFAVVLVVLFGFYFRISSFEWLALSLVIGLVLVAEAFNTAIEIDINLTSPEYHPYARDTKDVAAGAVLLAAIISVIVGLIVFLPKIL